MNLNSLPDAADRKTRAARADEAGQLHQNPEGDDRDRKHDQGSKRPVPLYVFVLAQTPERDEDAKEDQHATQNRREIPGPHPQRGAEGVIRATSIAPTPAQKNIMPAQKSLLLRNES